MDIAAVESRWREVIEENLRNHELQARMLRLEKKAKEALLKAAEANSLRVGRYKGVRNERGQEIDFNGSGKNTLKLRLAQIEFELEQLEGLIAVEREELASLTPGEGGES